jgi:hypothetical protein
MRCKSCGDFLIHGTCAACSLKLSGFLLQLGANGPYRTRLDSERAVDLGNRIYYTVLWTVEEARCQPLQKRS